jgi:predicted TIM-barrel fold metal-dependent hydrolase
MQRKNANMIIDFHTHAFPDTLAERARGALAANIQILKTCVTDLTVSGLIAYMDTCGVDVSVLQPVVTKPSQTVTLNEWAASAGEASGGRVVPFGGIFPRSDDYKRDIDLAVSLGLRGLKLHPEYQDFLPDEPQMLRVYDYALARGLILLFHSGLDPAYPPPFKATPERFARVLDAMRGGTIVIAHLGGHGEWDNTERYLAGRDVYLDTSMGFSYYPREQFLRIVRAHGADKILFATDSPWSAADEELKALQALPLTQSEKDAILSGNARRLLGL